MKKPRPLKTRCSCGECHTSLTNRVIKRDGVIELELDTGTEEISGSCLHPMYITLPGAKRLRKSLDEQIAVLEAAK